MERLEAGENSIARSQPFKGADGKWWLTWRIRLSDDEPTRTYRTKAVNKGLLRRRAYAKAEQVLMEYESVSGWVVTDSMSDYITKVSIPKIKGSKDLAPRTIQRYLDVAQYLLGDCATQHKDPDHRHRTSFAKCSIKTGTTMRYLENALMEIGQLHGAETWHQARTVLEKYVLSQMIRDGLITASPIAGKRLDKGLGKRTPRQAPVTVTLAQWQAVRDELLHRDPAAGVQPPKGGVYSLEDRIAAKRNSIDLALLQMTTGLRVDEATSVRWGEHVVTETDGELWIHLDAAITKTSTPRSVVVIDRDVAEHLKQRGSTATDGQLVIGSPAKPDQRWYKRQRDEQTRRLYDDLAQTLQIPQLTQRRTHIWRASLNTILADLPAATRATYLGHTEVVNEEHYLGQGDARIMAAALRGRLGEKSPQKSPDAPHNPDNQ